MPDLMFEVSAENGNPTKTIVKARGFTMTVDEPPMLGGTDEGANPVEYLLAAYCGCLNVVLHTVASEMGIQVSRLKFRASGPLNPARFLGKSMDNRAGFQSITIDIDADCSADADTRQDWLARVMERCPVGDNIRHATPVDVRIG